MAFSPFDANSQHTALTAPEGAGARSCYCLTRDAILPYLYGNSVQLIGLEVTTGLLRSVGSRLWATGANVAWCTWVRVPKDGVGPTDPVGVSESGARASGNIFLAQGVSFPLAF